MKRPRSQLKKLLLEEELAFYAADGGFLARIGLTAEFTVNTNGNQLVQAIVAKVFAAPPDLVAKTKQATVPKQ